MSEGRDGYFVNFMINQFPGCRQNQMCIMTQQVERVHSMLIRAFAHPQSDSASLCVGSI
jgi:hypothetical protein